jgi:serine phosphatase RsbU (regulator of sigma subunit)
MEIATTIQTALLPRNTEVAGLRIAAAMRPASEVGGDYYEVIPTETGCWLAIGDVAGHGLGAGLVMLMVQTAVLALTRAMPEAKPSEILKALNRALYENIRERLGKDEHVTLTLLRYETNGRLVFAGAHDDFVLYRKSSGRHELVRSPGTWLGAVADISDTSEDQELKLEEGDLLVLYTDGITEAANASREVFGIDRVCATVDRVHAEAPTAIRDELLKEVSGWLKDQQDDMTLVVLSFQGTKLAKTDAMGKETPRGAVSTPPVAVHLGRQV